jgi:phage tail tape measure protein
MEDEKKNKVGRKVALGCLPFFILLFLLPIILILALAGGSSNSGKKGCSTDSINAGGHIFAEDYVVLQGFGLTAWAKQNIGTLYGNIGHTGIDVQPTNFRDFNSEKVGVHTISDGTVEVVSYTGIGGNYVLIDMGSGKHAYYGHLREATVKQGDQVKKGDQIGILGNTGATTVYHVHFEVQENPPNLATKDSSPYLGKDVLNNGDIIRVNDKLETHVESSGKSNCSEVNGIDKDLVGNENSEKVWNFFKKRGFSPEATAGIMGNFQRESGMNPAITEIGNGIGFGLAQWSFERRTKLENWSKEKNLDVASLTAQLNFTIEEMKNIQFGSKSFEDFKNIRDVSEATELFERYFERAGVVALAERLKFAEAFYRQYK